MDASAASSSDCKLLPLMAEEEMLSNKKKEKINAIIFLGILFMIDDVSAREMTKDEV